MANVFFNHKLWLQYVKIVYHNGLCKNTHNCNNNISQTKFPANPIFTIEQNFVLVILFC